MKNQITALLVLTAATCAYGKTDKKEATEVERKPSSIPGITIEKIDSYHWRMTDSNTGVICYEAWEIGNAKPAISCVSNKAN